MHFNFNVMYFNLIMFVCLKIPPLLNKYVSIVHRNIHFIFVLFCIFDI